MRAVNLIPAEERRGAGGAAGRSGGAAYVLLGLLAVMVAVAAFHTVTKRSVADTRAQVVAVEAQAAAAEGRAAELATFTQFAGMRAARTQTVTSLAASRFDWSHALREIARVVPEDVSLTALQGTVAPGVAVSSGGASTSSSLRSALPVPAVEISGCATEQTSVARMLTRMRLVDGVTRVSLQSSKKSDAGAASTTTSATGGGCRQGEPGASPTFALVVFFDQAAGSVPTSRGAARLPVAQGTPDGATGATGASASPSTPGAP